MAGTLAIALAVLATAFTAWTIVCPAPPVERTLTVELLPLASPRQPVRDVAPGPRQVERKAVHAEHRPRPDPPPIVAIATPLAPPLPAPSQETPPSDPAPPVPQTTAPRAIAAPAATRLSDPAPSNWEGALLAHLERFRRYPAHARAAGQQGTVYVTFRMNRAGAVLEARVVRGSQSASLDQAALDTIRRAQPLPAIPPDRPDIMELTIPVEFYLQTG